jgi:hypothetical protein
MSRIPKVTSPTGDTVYVAGLPDLARFKSGSTYTFPVPIVFTHAGVLDFVACNLVVLNDGVTTNGSLHGMSGQKLTASALAGPFITFRGNALIELLTVQFVAHLFDLDGTAAGPAPFVNLRTFIGIGCASTGTITGYANMTATESGFVSCGALAISALDLIFQFVFFDAMSGGVVLSGANRAATLQTVSFTPLAGVTALTVPDGSSFSTTIDLRLLRFVLDTPTSIGLAIHKDVGLDPEALDAFRVIFTKTAGGDPVGVPIPPGHLDGASNKSHFERCRPIPNSSNLAYYTTAGNTEPTPNAAPGTPVVAVLTPPLGAVDVDIAEGFSIDAAGRVTYTRGLSIRAKVTWIASISGQANKTAILYVGTGSVAPGPVVPAAAVLRTGVPAPLNVGGNATSITVEHAFEMAPGSFAEPWIDADAGEPKVVSIKAFVEMA